MISNRNIINLILEIKKQVLQPYHCLIDSLFLIERFYNVKKTKKTKKTDQPCLVYILIMSTTMDVYFVLRSTCSIVVVVVCFNTYISHILLFIIIEHNYTSYSHFKMHNYTSYSHFKMHN